MRLLFDESLSYRLVSILSAEYPESAHVKDLGLKGAADQSIWQFARDNGYAVVSKDSDFRDQSFVAGLLPKPSGWMLAMSALQQSLVSSGPISSTSINSKSPIKNH